MSTVTQPHTNGHDREPGGVRTYRGRKLEDLIPQIRAELGPDAIILRQREGLMGGVGGFFAQKCVEVDAQAAPRVDIYDDDKPVNGWDDFDYSDDIFDETPSPVAADPAPIAPMPAELPALPAAEEPPAPEAFAPPAPEAFAPPAPEAFLPPAPEAPAAPEAATPAPAAAPAPEGAAESFVNRLEQAAAHVDIDELVKLVTTGGLPTPDQVDEAPEPSRRRADRRPSPPSRSRALSFLLSPRPNRSCRRRPSPSPRLPRRRRRSSRRPPLRRSWSPGPGTGCARARAGAGPAGRQPLGGQAGRRSRSERRDHRRPGAHLTGRQRRLGPGADRGRGGAPLPARRRQPA